jgi:hypothetical protein
MHLVRLRTSARNRIFGLLTQWGLRLSLKRLRAPDAMDVLAACGVEEAWRRSIAEALEVIDLLDARIAPLDAELRPLAAADPRVLLLRTIPGLGDLLGLTFAAEIGDISRFSAPRKLIGYAGLAPKISQSGDRSRTGALSKAGSRTLRWAAVEAAHQSWRPTNPWHALYADVTRRAGKNPAKSAVARKVHDRRLARALPRAALQPGPPAQHRLHHRPGKLPLLSGRLTALHGIEKPRQLPRTLCDDPSAEREMSTPLATGSRPPRPPPLTPASPSKRKQQRTGDQRVSGVAWIVVVVKSAAGGCRAPSTSDATRRICVRTG